MSPLSEPSSWIPTFDYLAKDTPVGTEEVPSVMIFIPSIVQSARHLTWQLKPCSTMGRKRRNYVDC